MKTFPNLQVFSGFLLSGHHGKSQRPAEGIRGSLGSLERQRGCRQMEKYSAADEDLPEVGILETAIQVHVSP